MFEAIWIGFAFAIHRGQSQNQTRSLQTYCRDTKYGRNNYLVKQLYGPFDESLVRKSDLETDEQKRPQGRPVFHTPLKGSKPFSVYCKII